MFSGIRKLLGAIKVTEEKGMIHVEGLPSREVVSEIFRIWSTSKIANNMFTNVTNSSLSFNAFFALDFLYTIETIFNGKKGQHQFRILGRVIDLMYEHTWLRRLVEPQDDVLNFSCLKELNVKLLDHQMEFLHVVNEKVPTFNLNGYVLGSPPGSGKTIGSLATAICWEADVVICVVPKTAVIDVWIQTISTRFVKPQKFWASTMNTEPPKGLRFYIFHYEQLERAVQFFSNQKFKKPVIILDESHNLNEMNSARTQLLIKLAQAHSAFTLWTSGTPLKALGKEAIPILKTTAPDFNQDAETRFLGIFGKNSTKATDILRNRLGQMTYRVDKNVVVGNTVETIEHKVQIPNGEKYTLDSIRTDMRDFIIIRMKYYQENMKSYIATYEKCLQLHSQATMTPQSEKDFKTYKNYIVHIRQGYDPATMKHMVMFCNNYELKEIVPHLPKDLRDPFKSARSVVKYYQLKVQGEALGRILGKMRAQCHVDMVPYMGLERLIEGAITKTVIFTSYVEVVDSAASYLSAKGYSPLKVYGDTNKDLSKIIALFRENIDANPLIATFQSLSTAVPLVMANQAILANAPFRDFEYQQATARVDRLDQPHPVRIVNIFLDTGAKPNISTRSGEIMEWSKEQVEAMLGPTPSLDISLECFSDLVPNYSVEEIKQVLASPEWMQWTRTI